MGRTIAELGQSMSAKEYDLWKAEYMIEPWGEERADLRTGTIVQSNLAPHSKEPVKLKDCILSFKEPIKQTWQDMKKMLSNRTAMLKGK